MPMTWSATKKNTAAAADSANTRPVVISVSLRDGHVTFATSARTSPRNFAGFNANAMLPSVSLSTMMLAPRWQGWRVSNPQPPVLETGALAN